MSYINFKEKRWIIISTLREKIYKKLHPILDELVDLACSQIESIGIENNSDESTAFNMDTVLDQLDDYGKYKGILQLNNDKCESYIPVSVAKQILRGRGLGGVLGYLKENNEVVKDCSTCKNNVE